MASVRPLRAALVSLPLWGAGRVEDTDNLLGHALRKALRVIADQQGWGLAVAGAASAQHVLELLRTELERAMILAGVPNIASIDGSLVNRS